MDDVGVMTDIENVPQASRPGLGKSERHFKRVSASWAPLFFRDYTHCSHRPTRHGETHTTGKIIRAENHGPLLAPYKNIFIVTLTG
ncbi:hypothetical protein APX70_00703 [Pseudomonas syringae pv. maculicola]|uniref:Uncharacterized protein n=1 Tax=Pseudomonas syringae pv. maculicola TaxID=59511 RepID=A0A3M3AZY2_PSEYM|nr:hypothetical protein APX70_00703 [Pseudomonas syringae pv. maculicola]